MEPLDGDDVAFSEPDLVLPALLCIESHPGITTADLKLSLRELLRPSRDDLETNPSRADSKFDQKVRNLKSHNTLEEAGLATYTGGRWELTEAGRRHLEANRELLQSVLAGKFPLDIQQRVFGEVAADQHAARETRVPLSFDEDDTVTEGQVSESSVRRRKRSWRLRNAAKQQFMAEGDLSCEACGFNFSDTYGKRGEEYIEIHHRVPIFMYEDEDLEQTVATALENLVPLCSNCHRMIHRMREDVWTVEQLQEVLRE